MKNKITLWFKRQWKARGDSILEVVVSTALLSSVLVATFTILNRAVQTNINIRNRIISLNIAREGIEGVRNIRDTNWLKYSGDRRNKWLCLDTTADKNACFPSGGGGTMDSGGTGTYYLLDYDLTDNRYYLELTSLQADLDLSDSAQTNQAPLRLYQTTAGRYTHTTTTEGTNFYRQIFLNKDNPYEGTPPTFCDSDDASCDNARLKVVSRVQWLEEGRLRTTLLEGHLFDFFERHEY